jgi:hypothetical protein
VVRGRLVLPKLLYSIGVLEARNAYPELRGAALDFLKLVTTAKSANPRHSTEDWFDHRNCVALCIDHFSTKLWPHITAQQDGPLPVQLRDGPSLLLRTDTEHAVGEIFDLQREEDAGQRLTRPTNHSHLRLTPQQSMGQVLSRLDEIQQSITRLAAHKVD